MTQILTTCLLSSVLLHPQDDGSMVIKWHHEGPPCYVAVLRSNYLIDVIPSLHGENEVLDLRYKRGHVYTLNTFTSATNESEIKSYVPQNQYSTLIPIVVQCGKTY